MVCLQVLQNKLVKTVVQVALRTLPIALFGQNKDKTFPNQPITPSLLQRTGLTVAG